MSTEEYLNTVNSLFKAIDLLDESFIDRHTIYGWLGKKVRVKTPISDSGCLVDDVYYEGYIIRNHRVYHDFRKIKKDGTESKVRIVRLENIEDIKSINILPDD